MNRWNRDALIDLPLRIWVRLVCMLPYRVQIMLGGWFMRRLAVKFTDYKERILSNLARVDRDYTKEQKAKILYGCLDNCGRMFAEYFTTQKFVDRVKHTTVTGPGIKDLQEAHLNGQSVVFATGHFGNFEAGRAALINQVRVWEAAGISTHSQKRAMMIKKDWIVGGLYRPTNNVAYERHHLASFSYIGKPAIPKSVPGLRELIAYLRSSGWVMFLHDQHDASGISVKFMGVDAMTSISAARLALRNKCLLIPYYSIRQSNGLDFEVVVEKPISQTTEEEMVQQLTNSLEAMVDKYPEQWFWVHRRWRT